MSAMQEQVVRRVAQMSDADAKFLLEIIDRLIPTKDSVQKPKQTEKMQAFLRLEDLRGGFPADFDADKELAEAREAKYGCVD